MEPLTVRKTAWNMYSEKTGTEKNDCTVKAFTHALTVSYDTAHSYITSKGRKERKGFNSVKIFQGENELFNHYITRIEFDKNPSIGQFLKNNPKGVYYVTRKNHAFCIKEGIVFDNVLNTRRQIVRKAWKITPKEGV